MSDFNFDNMTDVKETDHGSAVATTKFNFSKMEDLPNETPVQRISAISRIARSVFKFGFVDQVKTAFYLTQHLPEAAPGESIIDYQNKADAVLEEREKDIMSHPLFSGGALETPMQVGLAAGVVTDPLATAIGVGAYAIKDKLFNLRRFVDEKFPNTAPEIKDIAELADFAVTGAFIGKGMYEAKKGFLSVLDGLGIPRNVNIAPDVVGGVKDSGNLTIEEKADFMQTLGVEQKHVDASLSGGVPINVPVSKVMDLAEKPYWEIVKHELLGGAKGEAPLDFFGQLIETKPINVPQEVLSDLKTMQTEKNISGVTMKRLKDFAGIENIKKSPEPLVKKLVSFLEDLKPEDKFLSEKQLVDLKDIIKELPNPEVTPKRIVIEKFGDKSQILSKGLSKIVDPRLAPTVNIKEGNPLVAKIVDNVSEKMIKAEQKINERNKKLDEMVTAAEKSRKQSLSLGERIKRKIYPQNKEIFSALGGERVQLTKEEAGVVAYLKNFFQKAKGELKLESYRKNYVTHLEQPLTEKILTKGLFAAIKDIFRDPKQTDLPVDIMLELENIIGSEKFFKFALERKGGVEPTTNIREIINQYSHLYETKKALDEVLPEGQAIIKNLLEGKSALWSKRFLQNLKGRGLDNEFRNGPMGWLARTADQIVTLGYYKLLGLNWKSPLKNIVAGEVNSWIYQDFPIYMKGKERFFSNPKKAYDLALEYGALEGTYTDFAQKGIGNLKKLGDLLLSGQKIGEIEIRASILSSMLTDKEWAVGKVSPEHVTEIRDVIAKTQGIFTKWDTPLLLQTWYGRMFMQMNRWRITNAALLHEITLNAYADVKGGNFKSQNVSRFGKMVTAYGLGIYLAYQFGMAGYKTASDVAKNMAQTVDGIFSLFTEGELKSMITENPTFELIGEFSNTVQNTAKYLHVPGAKKTKEKGIDETYIAPIESTKDILEAIND